jgi:hypothetical protein
MSQGSPYGSPSGPFGSENPYMSPQEWPGPWGQPTRSTPDMPGFCKAMFAVSLVFCFIRAAAVSLGLAGMGMLSADDPAMKMAVFEIGSGLGMVLCGVPGNALLLAKNRMGVFLGCGLIVFTMGSILTGLITVLIAGNPAALNPPSTPGTETAELVGYMIGAGLSILVRVSIIAAYAAALIQFQNWHSIHGQGVGGSTM